MDIQSLFSLEGRIALVTGGSRGIGKMFVEGLLAAGCARVYISARKADQMQATIDEFGADRVIGIPADLSQMDGMVSLANELKARETRLDILINNAGAAWGQPYLEFSEAGWHRTMDLN
ncbi:MAG TPA: SDR family NAD(P)-dependent oxidoreductase, partial [Erythrobacter sp.]|nr:SDR family NAD(P)-dependent oxidoreductase [Erythrobacter sp.]